MQICIDLYVRNRSDLFNPSVRWIYNEPEVTQELKIYAIN